MRLRPLDGLAAAVTLGIAVPASAQAVLGEPGLYGGRAQTQRNREAAVADARWLLTRMRLPAGASRERSTPVARPSRGTGAAIDETTTTWTVPGTMGSVTAYERSHRPRGASLNGTGESSTAGTVTGEQTFFTWPAVADVLTDRQLIVSVSPLGADRVRLSAQAESGWLVARPDSERLPARTRRIVLQVTEAHHRALTRMLTRPATVARVVELLNAIPVTQPGAYSCPAEFPNRERTFAYRLLDSAGTTLARVGYAITPRSIPSPCSPMTVTIAGRVRDPLIGGPPMVEVQRMLGIPTDAP